MGGKRNSSPPRGASIGRRAGRNTTFEAPAFGDEGPAAVPDESLEPDGTGAVAPSDLDGYHVPTAMFDRGEFLGELADMVDGAPSTRAQVEAEEAPKGCKLIVVVGPDLGMEWSFKQEQLTMGRGSENEIDFSDIAVSREHARIVREQNRFQLVDLGSQNGTLLNGQRVNGRAPLSPGDEIVVGARTLRFIELSETPPTAAAHPIAEPGPEPAVGRVSELAPALKDEPVKGKNRLSQVNIGVVPKVDGPDIVEIPEVKRTGRGPARLLSRALLTLVLLVAIGVGGYFGYRRLTGLSEKELQLLDNQRFLQGVELVKHERFGDAKDLFAQVLLRRPEYTRAKEYLAHCDQEIERFRTLQSAQQMAAGSRQLEALARTEAIPTDSAYFARTQKQRSGWLQAVAEGKVLEARGLFMAGDLESALELAKEALLDVPNLPSAQALIEEIEETRSPKKVDGPRPKKRDPIPPDMERAVALYQADKIPAAIDAAEAAGGPNAPIWMDRMRRIKNLLSEIDEAHRQKAAAEVLRLVPTALELDKQIAGGEGEVRGRIRHQYADALYLKGLAAYQSDDLSGAFRLLIQATETEPGHRLSEARLLDISKKAKELYNQGYALKDTQAKETRRVFKRVTEMTPKDNPIHQWASKWLASNGG